MKVIFDSNIYISWIRDNQYTDLMLNPYTLKYMSAIVLMELWAGAKNKSNALIVEKLQQVYLKTNRIINFSTNNYINVGKIISEIPNNLKSKITISSFINDIFIAQSAYNIGANLYTENKNDFEIIRKYFKGLKICYC